MTNKKHETELTAEEFDNYKAGIKPTEEQTPDPLRDAGREKLNKGVVPTEQEVKDSKHKAKK